jgi:hypothetical protein
MYLISYCEITGPLLDVRYTSYFHLLWRARLEYNPRKASTGAKMLPFATLSIYQLCLLAFTIYNICWLIYTTLFHPLAKFPGPLMGRLSRWWYVYFIIRGNQGENLRRLHLEYGPIVRIAPDEVSIADPSAINEIYGFKRPFVKPDFYKAFDSDGGEIPNRFTATDEKYHAILSKKLGDPFSMRNIQSRTDQRGLRCVRIADGTIR